MKGGMRRLGPWGGLEGVEGDPGAQCRLSQYSRRKLMAPWNKVVVLQMEMKKWLGNKTKGCDRMHEGERYQRLPQLPSSRIGQTIVPFVETGTTGNLVCSRRY